jgi:enterochelin esterase-like enzyme
MSREIRTPRIVVPIVVAVLSLIPPVFGQAAATPPGARGGRGPQGPAVVSPEVAADRRVTFRILAPEANSVSLTGTDIPGNGQGAKMTKGGSGVWEVTLGPIGPGAYRYTFNVDGVATVDPRSPVFSESNNNIWSLVYVPGSDFMDTREVPHGAVAAVTYYSTTLKRARRMHIYTPPGYETGEGKFPVFYLLHGASDSDDSWSSVGRAGFIIDNLIAAKKAKPMIVVMPAGHTQVSGVRGGASDEFVNDFLQDIMPYVDKNYRVYSDGTHRAIAGLSMGGSQTLNIALPHLRDFAYIGVFSSGLFGAGRGEAGAAAWEQEHLSVLDNADLKKDLKLFWFSTGKDDFLSATSTATVDMLKKHGFNVVYHRTEGGHTWINWRNYLNEFAPQLFQ